MNESRGLKVVLASAAALLAVSLAVPASAQDRPAQSSGPAAQSAATEVPAPKARPVVRKKRVASVRRPVARPAPYWYWPYYERVAVHWPMIFVGVGF
jgi:hypothetical protein